MLRDVFDKIDKDGGGSVDNEELFEALADMDLGLGDDPAVRNERLAQLIKDADSDNSGEIEFDEFVTAIKKQLELSDGEPASGLGALITQSSLFQGFSDLWSTMTTPLKALDNIIATPMKLFQAEEKAVPQDETDPGKELFTDPAAEFSSEIVPRSPTVYGSFDLSGRIPRKAATPKRFDNKGFILPKEMKKGVPASKFKDETQAKTFFSAPRIAATGTTGTSRAGAAFSSYRVPAARPSTFLGNNAAIAISRAVGRPTMSTPPRA